MRQSAPSPAAFLRLSATLLGVLVVVAAAPASAQNFEQGLRDPRLISPAGLGPVYSGLTGAGVGLLSKKPAYGVLAGDFILQPRFFLEGSYNSNFFRIDDRNGDPEGVFTTHIRPGVALFNPQYDKVAFSLGLDVDVFLPVSGNDDVTSQTNVGGTANVAVALFPKSALTLTLHEEFNRTIWMRPQIQANANRNWNRAGVDLSFHPGGRALDFTLGYVYELKRFDDLDTLDTDSHVVRFLASWRFYPLTYAFLESTVQFGKYTRDATAAEQSAVGNYVPGSPVKAYLGLSGYITERLALLVRAGYGNSLLDREPADFSSFIGQLQLSYRFSQQTILHVGAARDFDLAPLGGYMQYFRAYASLTQRIGEIVEITADFAYDIRDFGEWQPVANAGQDAAPVASDPARSENWIRAGVLLDFDISRLLGVSAGYRYDSVLSDYTLTSNGQTTFTGYDDHRVFASINFRY